MTYLRTCTICKNEFTTTSKATYCSNGCKELLRKRRIIEGNAKIQERRRQENNEKYKDVVDIPTCKLCNWKSISLQNHLITHNLTVQQYRDQYQATNAEIFHSSYTKIKSDRISGDKNPGYQHNGTMSSFSKAYTKYDGLTEDLKIRNIHNQISKANDSKRKNNSYTTTAEYYITRGFSPEEAEVLLKQRQTTFSLEKCIEKYGKEAGTERWINRQEKWLASSGVTSLKSGVSKISQELFNALSEQYTMFSCFFATNGHENNNEYVLKTPQGVVRLDFFVPATGKIIEFDGDYWHSDKNPRKICRETRDYKIKTAFPHYQILHVWEGEYRKDKEGTIQKCLNFLKT